MIDVAMGQQDHRNRHLELFYGTDDAVDVAARIDDNTFIGGLVEDQ